MRWLAQMTPRWMACHSSLPLLFIAALDLLYWHICFFLIFFFLLIIKIFLTSGTRDRAGVSASLEAHHWKLAWVSTICHETKQASLSNLYNINNSMPHFYTCAGGPQYCRGFWGGGGLTVFRHLRLSNCVFNSPCAVQEAAWNLGKRDGAPRREIHRY